eukprot:scaffold196749_cov14-Tisochrysis_lutea.AAC.1
MSKCLRRLQVFAGPASIQHVDRPGHHDSGQPHGCGEDHHVSLCERQWGPSCLIYLTKEGPRLPAMLKASRHSLFGGRRPVEGADCLDCSCIFSRPE